MRAPIFTLALLLSVPAFASDESADLAAIRAEMASLRAEVAALRSPAQPAPTPRVSQRYTNAARALLGYRFAAFGSPIFAFPGYSGGGSTPSTPFSGGTVSGATTFSDDVTFNGGTGALGFASGETLVPADGTLNVTGPIKMGASGDSVGTGTGGSLSEVGFFSTALRLRPPAGASIQMHDGSQSWGLFSDVGTTGAMTLGATAFTIADSGGAGAATSTTLPEGFVIVVTCSDAEGCEWTPTETSAVDGRVVNIINTSANTLTIKHAAGQVLLNGGTDEALGQYDSLTLFYGSTASAWIQVGTTGNN